MESARSLVFPDEEEGEEKEEETGQEETLKETERQEKKGVAVEESDLRALRRQLERAKAFTTSMPDVRLLWPQYQELVRSLHCQYQDASAANKARLHMYFTMLLLFAVNPGRGRELRTLRLLMEMPEGGVQTLLRGLPEGDNVVVISDNGPVWLVETGYKTAACSISSKLSLIPYGGPKVSRQNRKPQGKTKNLPAKPNTSQQKQNSFGFAVGICFCHEEFGFCFVVFDFAVRSLVLP